jgi:hypothetical protein
MTDFLKKLIVCESKEGKERNDCLYDLLYEVTEFQDKVNLSIDWDYNYSTRLSGNIANEGNAMLLGIARHKGDIRGIVREGYVEEKVGYLIRDWNAIAHEWNNYVDDAKYFQKKFRREQYDDRKGHISDKEVRDWNKKHLFEGF